MNLLRFMSVSFTGEQTNLKVRTFQGSRSASSSVKAMAAEALPALMTTVRPFGGAGRWAGRRDLAERAEPRCRRGRAVRLPPLCRPHLSDPRTLIPALPDLNSPEGVSGLRVALTYDLGFFVIEDEVRAWLDETAAVLERAGAIVGRVDLGWDRTIADGRVRHWHVYLAAFFGEDLDRIGPLADPRLAAVVAKGRSYDAVSLRQTDLLRKRQAPMGRSASVAAAAERFERLLAAKIGADRAPKAIKAILTTPGFETAEGRLVAEIDSCEAAAPPAEPAPPRVAPEPAQEPAPIVNADAPAAPRAPRRRRDADIEAKARRGELPPPPDFSAPTHARLRAKLAALVEMAGKADATGLRAVPINPVSSSPKALARYRDLAVLAIGAREGRA